MFFVHHLSENSYMIWVLHLTLIQLDLKHIDQAHKKDLHSMWHNQMNNKSEKVSFSSVVFPTFKFAACVEYAMRMLGYGSLPNNG